MADFDIYIVAEGDITLSGGAILDGEDQGDGSHLANSDSPLDPPITLTINNGSQQLITVSDNGSDTSFADNDGNQTLTNDVTLVPDSSGVSQTYAAGTTIEAEYEFTVEDDEGNTYRVLAVNFVAGPGNSFGTIEALAFVGTPPPTGVELTITSAFEGPPNPGTTVNYSDVVPVCFLEGTLIETSTGTVPVEQLKIGQQVIGADGRRIELRYVVATDISLKALQRNDKLYPVRISKGALGQSLPNRDLYVSRQHRMQVSSEIAQRMFGTKNVLISAVRLCGLPNIEIDRRFETLTYYHLVFNQHEVILAEGAPSESLFLGDQALHQLPADVIEELQALDLISDRPFAKGFIPSLKRQNKLAARHAKNAQPLIGSL